MPLRRAARRRCRREFQTQTSSNSDRHIPADNEGKADEHGECVMIDVAALQLDDAPRHIDHSSSDAIRPEPVDDSAIAALPEQPAKPKSRAYEDYIIEFVKIPFVEKEFVERAK